MESHCVTFIIGHFMLGGSPYWMITGFKSHRRLIVYRPIMEDLKALSSFGRFGKGALNYIYRREAKFIPIAMQFAGTGKTFFTNDAYDRKIYEKES